MGPLYSMIIDEMTDELRERLRKSRLQEQANSDDTETPRRMYTPNVCAVRERATDHEGAHIKLDEFSFTEPYADALTT